MLNTEVIWIMILMCTITRNWRIPECHRKHRLRQTALAHFISDGFCAPNETCQKADGLKQRCNQLQDLSAVPSEVTENTLMPLQTAKLLLIPKGQTTPPYMILNELHKASC